MTKEQDIKHYADGVREFSTDISHLADYIEQNPDNLSYGQIQDFYLDFLKLNYGFLREVKDFHIKAFDYMIKR